MLEVKAPAPTPKGGRMDLVALLVIVALAAAAIGWLRLVERV
jgi:hypothetical protein